MNKYIVTIMVFMIASIIVANAQNGKEIIKKSGDLIALDAMEMISTLKIYNEKGSERIRKMATATKKFGETTKMMMKFTEPADVRGTTILIFDYENQNDDMWIYMPALRKSRRIVSSEKGKNFMGSEFTNADMSKPNLSDFNYTDPGEETIDSKKCWKVESLPKNSTLEGEYGFSKRISFVEKQTNQTCRIEYYDLQGKLLRVETIKDYKKQPNGSYFAFYMEIENVQNGRKSVMTIDNFQVGSSLSENAFTPAMLEK